MQMHMTREDWEGTAGFWRVFVVKGYTGKMGTEEGWEEEKGKSGW